MFMVITTITVSVVIILLLTVFIQVAEWKLVIKGDVRILINGDEDRALEVEAGRTLLDTLMVEKIYLPSACGGKGTCGTCLCRVTSGGGELLPTEKTHINRKMERQDYRLACQLKVKENMNIIVPEEVFSVKRLECEVISNENVATFIKEFVLKLPQGENLDFKPGGYIQIEIPSYSIDFSRDVEIGREFLDDWMKFGFLDLKMKNSDYAVRAYSMANYPDEGDIVMLNVRIATPPFDRSSGRLMNVPAGVGSSYIFSRKPGDRVMVSGPYGEFFIRDTAREMVYIGGGAGMAPLRSHIFHLLNTINTDRKVSYWYGARSLREVFYEDHFRRMERENSNFSFNLALSDPLPADNWKGYTGFVHDVVYENYLKNHPEPEEVEYYLCGPPLMLDAVKKMLYDLGVENDMILYDEFS